MSSVKYATEDNIRSLILLIKEELSGYVTIEDFEKKLEDLSINGSSLLFKKVESLPDTGESNTIYLVKNGGSENNIYDEYYWDSEDSKFELFGSTEATINIAQQEDIDDAYSDKIQPNLVLAATLK